MLTTRMCTWTKDPEEENAIHQIKRHLINMRRVLCIHHHHSDARGWSGICWDRLVCSLWLAQYELILRHRFNQGTGPISHGKENLEEHLLVPRTVCRIVHPMSGMNHQSANQLPDMGIGGLVLEFIEAINHAD